MEKKDHKKEKSRGDVRIGISIGDTNGIGIEVTMKALEDSRILQDCTPVIYGSQKLFALGKKQFRMNNFNFNGIKTAADARKRKVNVVNVWDEDVEVKYGETNESGGKYAFRSLEAATQDLAAGKIDVLVTAPISKEAMAKTGFQFPGHTEYLADMAGQEEALMLMVSSTMRIGLVTSHIALKDVSTTITVDKVLDKINAFNASLKKDFGIQRPKIAVFGLNPHAGENGKMGDEEKESIIPAISRAQNDGILAYGPFPADGFFGSGSRDKFDGVLAMYHDQGLAAFKALAFDEGVNFTAGLPIIRTSPDHGTAFDIAGQNVASGGSMRQAIYLAIDVFRNHQFEKEITANPLVSQPREKKGRDQKRNDK
jgi:4-hydroxythreonine-4-phosphate dehydrogenase